MPLGERPVDLDQLEPDDLEPALLVAGQDAPGQQALDAVGFHQDQGPFGHVLSLFDLVVAGTGMDEAASAKASRASRSCPTSR